MEAVFVICSDHLRCLELTNINKKLLEHKQSLADHRSFERNSTVHTMNFFFQRKVDPIFYQTFPLTKSIFPNHPLVFHSRKQNGSLLQSRGEPILIYSM